MVEADDGIGTDCDVDQLGVSDELQVATRIGGNGATPIVDQLEQFGYRLPFSHQGRRPLTRALFRELDVDCVHEVTSDACDHSGNWNRLGNVMDEIDENGQVDKK